MLNRYSDFDNPRTTVHIMKYIFPRQFGLHNVFTSTVDSKETVQPFKDYTLREQEIAQRDRQTVQDRANKADIDNWAQRTPKRLRGEVLELVKKLQVRHTRCSYHQLILHYCSLKVSKACMLVGIHDNTCLRRRIVLEPVLHRHNQILRT